MTPFETVKNIHLLRYGCVTLRRHCCAEADRGVG